MNKIRCTKAEKSFYNRIENACKEIAFEGEIPNQDDQVSQIAILLGKYMQYRFRVWKDYGGAVGYTLKEFRSRTKISDICFQNVILYLNRNWTFSRFLPFTLVQE